MPSLFYGCAASDNVTVISFDLLAAWAGPNCFANAGVLIAVAAGGIVDAGYSTESTSPLEWRIETGDLQSWLVYVPPRDSQFRVHEDAVSFPLWYPARVFPLTGISVLSLRCQVSIRSALIATAVVAALIGMAIIL